MRALILALAISTPALAQVRSVDLGRYRLARTFNLPAEASESSAIAFDRSTGNLLVLGDEGEFLVEVTKAGATAGMMTLTGFDDTEGLTCIAPGQFVLVEERLQDVYRLTYTPGGSVARSSLPSASLGPTIGNEGIEGITYDPVAGVYIAVKEKLPMAVLKATISFGPAAPVVTDLFIPNLGVTDLADIQALSAVPSLAGRADGDNLLILSQESAVLLEVSRAGAVLSQFSFLGLADSAEGVTIDDDGVIYVCAETPQVFVLAPCEADCNADGALNLADFGCFQTKFALGDEYADCNGDGVRNLADFGCFQTKFALGCP